MSDTLSMLLERITVVRESTIAAHVRLEAWELCQDIDPTDTPHLAMTLYFDGRLWTGDKQLRAGLEAKGFDRFFDP